MRASRSARLSRSRVLEVAEHVLQHVCKLETLRTAYRLANANDGAPGIDGVTFDAIETVGVDGFLAQLRDELVTFRYRPLRNRQREIPKEGTTKVRILSIPAIGDRVVQER
jgi:RNA-directed DNA polymerase